MGLGSLCASASAVRVYNFPRPAPALPPARFLSVGPLTNAKTICPVHLASRASNVRNSVRKPFVFAAVRGRALASPPVPSRPWHIGSCDPRRHVGCKPALIKACWLGLATAALPRMAFAPESVLRSYPHLTPGPARTRPGLVRNRTGWGCWPVAANLRVRTLGLDRSESVNSGFV